MDDSFTLLHYLFIVFLGKEEMFTFYILIETTEYLRVL